MYGQYSNYNQNYDYYDKSVKSNPRYDVELSERQHGKFAQPLIGDSTGDTIVPNELRSCTDIVCAILIFLCIGGFTGLLIYGIIVGNLLSVISIYNGAGVQCNQQSNFYYGYLPNLLNSPVSSANFQKAVCVSSCPTTTAPAPCLPDGFGCVSGVYTPPYESFALAYFCIPESVTNVNVYSLFSFDFDAFGSWVYDLQIGWIVLVAAAVAAMLLSMIFFLVVRCCTGPIIWLAITIFIGGMITIGVFFILEAEGVTVPEFVADTLSTLSYDTLIIVGSCLLGASVLVLILVICMRGRIAMGAKAVELGSIFLFENCCLVILPITQALLVFGVFVALVVGEGFLYSTGTLNLSNNLAFAIFDLSVLPIVLISIYLAVSLWLIFFVNGCNHFMLSSAVAVWYFGVGSPCGDSLWRLVRYHSGSVAFTSLVNGLFFIIRIIASVFSFDAKDDDSALVSCCLKCLNALFCIFRIFLRFLSDGTYAQIAISGKGYCTSTLRAFNIISDNITKISITDGISIFFTILGILGITLGISVAAYFSILYIPYYQTRINNAFVVTVVSGMISLVISSIYLSMIDLTSASVLQCYLVDHELNGGRIRFANESVKNVLMIV